MRVAAANDKQTILGAGTLANHDRGPGSPELTSLGFFFNTTSPPIPCGKSSAKTNRNLIPKRAVMWVGAGRRFLRH